MWNDSALYQWIPEAVFYVSPLFLLAGLLGLVVCLILWVTSH